MGIEKLDKEIKEEQLNYQEYQNNLEDLQGDILRGHGRNHASHIFLQFKSEEHNQRDIKKWIRRFARRITSAHEQLEEARDYRNHHIPGSLFINFFLSSEGYRALGETRNINYDAAFEAGMKTRKQDAFKDGPGVYLDLNDPSVETWEEGYQKEIHAMVLLADDDEAHVRLETRRLTGQISKIADVCAVEYGKVLRNIHGDQIEHFGYADGLSQPLFFKRDVERRKAALGGKEVVPSGAGPDMVLAKDPHDDKKAGSYLVFRKLEQDVSKFHKQVRELSQKLGFEGEDAHDRAGALVVGRFPDGTPIAMSKAAGKRDLDFNFKDDPDGLRCPLHAHIRKVNPRLELSNATDGRIAEQRARITRRGMPYGTRDKEPIDQPSLEELPSQGVGLLFMCFQKNITTQFGRLQSEWANQQTITVYSSDTINGERGTDALIGQPSSPSAQKWPTQWDKDEKICINFGKVVTLKGGEYFFAASIPYLQNLGRD